MIKKNQCQMVVILGILLIAPLFVASFESPKRAASDTLVGEQDAIGPLPIKPEDIPRATNAGYSSGGGTIETDASIDITAAVFSQAEDPASGITFTYRVGPSPLVLFGESSVYYLLGNQTLALTFPGCNLVMPEGTNPLQSVTSYFRGNDQAKWRGGLVDYGAIIYEDLYPGIDLVYKSTTQGLKYEFLVAPDADPGQILLAFANADFIEADECVLRVEVGGEVLEDRGLIALQENGVGTELVQCAFQQTCGALIQFTLGEYDVSVPLVIDPVVNIMEYSTLIGGPGIDTGYGIAVEDGFAYITGYAATGYPTTPGANDSSIGGTYDAFVTKLSVDGSALVYSTFIGGSGGDYGYSIAVEGGCAYITGATLSDDFPTTAGAFNTTHSEGNNDDVFVTKVRADGCALIYSTFIGGAEDDIGQSIAVASGCAFVTGYTDKGGFDYPVTVGAYSTTHSEEGDDVFVTKLSSNGSTLVYSTFLGGTMTDKGSGIVVEEGFAYVTGSTLSSNYPTTTGAYDTSYNGGQFDAFVTKLSVDGSNLVYSTFLGAADDDRGEGIAVEDGCAFITGQTKNTTTNYPTTQGAFDTTHNGDVSDADAFVTKLSVDGSDLMYSTFLGGSGMEIGHAIAVENGFAYVTGESENASTNFPTTIGAYNKTHSGGIDAFVTKLSTDGSTLVYSTFLGAAGNDLGRGIAVEDECAYITGETIDAAFDYPTTVGAFNTTHNGNKDVFVTKLDTDADADGMPDGWETTYGLNPAYNDASLDFDEDDLDNSAEYAQGTDPSNPDTDGDYMPDGWEHAYSLSPRTNDATADNDGDGLTNLQEYQQGTSPVDPDTDDDTMHDQWEVTYNLDPLFNDAASDADGDGLNNSQECNHNTNPNLADSEGDGMPDGWEHAYSLSLLANDAATDADGDGLTNLQEYQLSTNPVDSDTDDDGITDGVEVASGTNPLNPASFPQEGNDSNLLLITYISLGVAVVSCILTVLLFVSFRRTNQKLVRDLETLNASIGKAEVPIPSKRDMDSSNAKDIKLPPVSGKSPVASPKDPHMDGKSKSSNTK